MSASELMLSLTLILSLGVLAQWISALIKIPSILLLLLTGILAGPVFGWIDPEKTMGNLLVPFTSFAIAIILFEGGLTLQIRHIKDVYHVIRNLVTMGVLVGLALVFCFLYFGLGYSFPFSLLQSAVLIITGPTVIIPILKALHVKQPIRSILKWEGIMVDPIGAIIAVVIFESILLQPDLKVLGEMGYHMGMALVIGTVFGVTGGGVLYYLLGRFWIPKELGSPVALMILLILFVASNHFQADSGLLSVTLAGVFLANQKKVHIGSIAHFKETLSLILIPFLFILLEGATDLEALKTVMVPSLFLVAFIILVSRPLSVLSSGVFSSLEKNQALFASCIAPRGIVTALIASLFGFQLEKAGFEQAEFLAPMAFFVIGGTGIFYSIFTPLAARYLKVASSQENGILIIGANDFARTFGTALKEAGFDVQLIDTNYWKVVQSKQSELPVYQGTFLAFETEFPEKMEEMSLALALTESDDINSMAIIHLRSVFDDSRLYQLSPKGEKIKESLLGRCLFGKKYSYPVLANRISRGALIKTTAITSEFSLEDWEAKNEAGDPILLFYITQGGAVIPSTGDDTPPLTLSKIGFLTGGLEET